MKEGDRSQRERGNNGSRGQSAVVAASFSSGRRPAAKISRPPVVVRKGKEITLP